MAQNFPRHPVAAKRIAKDVARETVSDSFGRLRDRVEVAILTVLRERDYYWSRRVAEKD